MIAWGHAVVQWPLSASVAAVVALSALVSWLAVSLVRRIWPHPTFKENNELVGFTYSVYGMIYGVFLAFIIVVSWQRFADTEQLVMHEATLLSELWRDSLAFPPAFRDNIHQDLIEYAQSVLDDEWPAMAARGQAHPHTHADCEPGRLSDRVSRADERTQRRPPPADPPQQDGSPRRPLAGVNDRRGTDRGLPAA